MAEDMMQVIRAKMLLDKKFVFFGAVGMNLTPVATASIPTLCTDGTKLWYNPSYVQSLTIAERMFVVAHEVMHPALGHPWRIGDRDRMQSNMAADYVINDMLIDAGMQMPHGCLYDKEISRGKDGEILAFEQVYSKLSANKDKQKQAEQGNQSQSGQGGQQKQQGTGQGKGKEGEQQGQSTGQGQGQNGKSAAKGSLQPAMGNSQGNQTGQKQGAADESGAPQNTPTPNCPTGDFVPASDPEEGGPQGNTEADWQIAVEQAVRVASAAGCMPGGLGSVLIKAREPKVDWVAELKEFVAKTMPSDYTWGRPNRRFLADGLLLPSMTKDGVGEIVLGIDTSGSTMGFQKVFADEFKGIIEEARPERCYIVYWDSSVQATEEVTPDEFDIEFKPRGFGGTCPEVMFQWVEDQGIQPKALICLTDLEFYSSPKDPGYPVLWAAPDYCRQTAPFGQVIAIPREE